MTSPIIIAIDGPSASGKGTIARKLAERLGFAHLDTGLLYRAVGLGVLRAGGDPSDAAQAEHAAQVLTSSDIEKMFNDPALREDHASVAASKVAAVPGVRAALLKFQKDFCAAPPGGKAGAVLDGRDIGTVIAPDAPVKIYVTANMEARAQRRYLELQKRGEKTSLQAVLTDMKERDVRDSQRSTAPAKPAVDAVILDTTNMTADQAFVEALVIVQKAIE